jgi:hypothetical protein
MVVCLFGKKNPLAGITNGFEPYEKVVAEHDHGEGTTSGKPTLLIAVLLASEKGVTINLSDVPASTSALDAVRKRNSLPENISKKLPMIMNKLKRFGYSRYCQNFCSHPPIGKNIHRR